MNFDAIPFHVSDRFRFTALMREFVSMGFTFSNQVTADSKKKGIIGYFLKQRG